MFYYHLKAAEWQYIFEALRNVRYVHRNNPKELRRFIEAVYYVLRGGIQWRLLPKYYGHWRSVHNRFIRWRNKGIWSILFEKATEDADLQEVMLDGTIVRSHACSSGYEKGGNAEQALGRSMGGFTTKMVPS